ncbi:MAG: hypothetical protein LBT04_07885, partial [Prevotellaceae bacterium]|nr:hypothetical protein [Prevotellaceae bacterium]
MGEVISQTRMQILPNSLWLTTKMEWDYDSWGRRIRIIYPDEEHVNYSYNRAGLLDGVCGNDVYISKINYNKLDLKEEVYYGNGTRSIYQYDTVMWRLQSNEIYDQSNNLLAYKDYSYNSIGNIEFLNGKYTDAGINIDQSYFYDPDNRLVAAQGVSATT